MDQRTSEKKEILAERCNVLLSMETDYETKREGTRNVEGAQEEKR